MNGVTYITRDGDCLDHICWRHYGRSSGMVELVLEANHGLAEKGGIYAENIAIFLPEVITKPIADNVINIWD
ncbi:phage tail protein [Pseudoalteromonas citrea]|jgi:phage tail protein X|uniref:Phage tail protein n=2 Tax=Pseudoalteromonas TaxID=53246 RepID=A0A5S3V8X2_9GAMM|nr:MULTISPECIES: tail protein X [Pseudoalteromonas]RJE78119.1 phage tail protein [Pseudoalteromonas sp. MSK9-3]TMO67274.1 phage tail protein [Pseudoalteromonas aurantia]TMO68309.1 phage tail protein [Pseudoalteromonas aurantia]TMO70864.1 phage tail protein [Pseudoalteromonas aurantia]TMP40759.1 phage tail protein [Pseudoalteromonas citrea]